jgi:hypothetical protein
VSELLLQTLVEIERHVADSGWDQAPVLFALARTAELMAREPAFAAQLQISAEELPDDALTPVEQDALPDGPLDEALAQVAWPEEVAGCALVQEVVMLPPEAEEAMPRHADVVDWAGTHPERREARLAVAVLRDGSRACTLRLRDVEEGELLVGPDLAPALADALAATLD